MTTTFERLCAMLTQAYKLAPGRLTLDAPLESLGIDSLGTVEMLWNVEDEFHITLPPDPVPLRTLGDVARYIDVLLARQGGAMAPRAGAEAKLRAT
jgi:acyl carrier protein